MKILAFGEVLWDVFGQKRVIGGAPFNFAGDFVSLGGEACILSAVGNDPLGDETRQKIRELGVDTRYVAKVGAPTGVCNVTLNENGVPAYELKRGMAYDNIPLQGITQEDVCAFDAIYFGTLAQRDAVSKTTLFRLLTMAKGKEILYDMNIRQTYYSKEIIEAGLHACTVLKFSREEAFVFTELGIISPEPCMACLDFLKLLCRFLSKFYDIAVITVTLDKDGAFSYEKAGDTFAFSQKPQSAVVSTVGAGDSFCAAYLYCKLAGQGQNQCLKNAVRVSDYVVTQVESVPRLPADILEEL